MGCVSTPTGLPWPWSRYRVVPVAAMRAKSDPRSIRCLRASERLAELGLAGVLRPRVSVARESSR